LRRHRYFHSTLPAKALNSATCGLSRQAIQKQVFLKVENLNCQDRLNPSRSKVRPGPILHDALDSKEAPPGETRRFST
jgi:hypothetical protein